MIVHTDGSSSPHTTGRGGWAYVCLDTMDYGQGSEEDSTNMRMEMMAILMVLKDFRNHTFLTIVTDSQVVVNCWLQEWDVRWAQNGWMKGGEHRKNHELWMALSEAWTDRAGLTLVHVRGHAGDPGNELADKLAVQANMNSLPLTRGRFTQQVRSGKYDNPKRSRS